VAAFSLSLPTSQVAVRQLGPVFATSGRAVTAAALAVLYLCWRRAALPPARLVPSLLVVAAGVVIGFPLFTALALQREDSAHGAVIVGLLPAATAALGALRNHERPSLAFWTACAAGAAAVTTFSLVRGEGLPTSADALTGLAVVAAAAGYAEGARLARALGPDQVICWALLLSLPLTVPVLALSVVTRTPVADAAGWSCFAYTAVVSMFLGFFAWYRGLALGGVAKVSQVQLAQPLLTVGESALLLGQHVDATILLTALAVMLCMAVAQRTRVHHRAPPAEGSTGPLASSRNHPSGERPGTSHRIGVATASGCATCQRSCQPRAAGGSR